MYAYEYYVLYITKGLWWLASKSDDNIDSDASDIDDDEKDPDSPLCRPAVPVDKKVVKKGGKSGGAAPTGR